MTGTALSRAVGCLLSGLVGDAMGAPTEGMRPADIEAKLGWVDEFGASGTDDSAMRDLLIRALFETEGEARAADWAEQWLAHPELFYGEMRERFFVTVLHTFEKLRVGYPVSECAIGNMPSSSSAMAISPVGIVNAGRPEAAAAQARDIGSLIHQDDVAFCADGAGVVASMVAASFVAPTLDAALDLARASAARSSSATEMWGLVDAAVELAETSTDYGEFRARYHEAFPRPIACDSRETIPAAVALVMLADGDVKTAVEYGANFGRDTDTIATMAGGIAGAWVGLDDIPPAWLEGMGETTVAEQTSHAERLLAIAQRKADRDDQEPAPEARTVLP